MRAYLRAVELCDEVSEHGSEIWANCVSQAFNDLMQPFAHEEPKPTWFEDETLKRFARQVVAKKLSDVSSWKMMGDVLCGGLGAWEAGPRTARDLRQAAAAYTRAVGLTAASTTSAVISRRLSAACRAVAGSLHDFVVIDCPELMIGGEMLSLQMKEEGKATQHLALAVGDEHDETQVRLHNPVRPGETGYLELKLDLAEQQARGMNDADYYKSKMQELVANEYPKKAALGRLV